MNRTEFIAGIKQLCENSTLKVYEICFRAHCNESHLRKILCGETNLFMTTIFSLLNVFNSMIVLSKNGRQDITLSSVDDLISWASESFSETGLTQIKFATEVGLSRNSLPSNMSGKRHMRVDTFLNWAKATDYKIRIA